MSAKLPERHGYDYNYLFKNSLSKKPNGFTSFFAQRNYAHLEESMHVKKRINTKLCAVYLTCRSTNLTVPTNRTGS